VSILTELVFQAKRLVKIDEVSPPSSPNAESRSVAVNLQSVKHETQIIQADPGHRASARPMSGKIVNQRVVVATVSLFVARHSVGPHDSRDYSL
jgi:hypothetical protein